MKLEIRGKHFIRVEDNVPVKLRGATLVGWVWGGVTIANEVNIARVWTTPVAEGGYGANALTLWVVTSFSQSQVVSYVRQIRNAIQPNGAYTIVAYAKPNDREHPRYPNARARDYMQVIAEEFRNDDSVLYMTQAEPGRGHPDTGASQGSALSWSGIKPHQEAMYDAIRTVKPDAVVGIAGTIWSKDYRDFANNPPFGNRDNDHPKPFFIKPHFYHLGHMAPAQEVEHQARIRTLSPRYPVVVGEFGQSGGYPSGRITRFVDYVEGAFDNVGWQVWNLMDRGGPYLLNSLNPRDVGGTGNGGQQTIGVLRKYEAAGGEPVGPSPPADPIKTIKVNTGGIKMGIWEADQAWRNDRAWGYVQGSQGGAASHGDDPLMMTERWGMDAYRFRVPDGKYWVRLRFKETWGGITGPGQRVFHVKVGKNNPYRVDPYEMGGGFGRVSTLTEEVEVKDGVLEIAFEKEVEQPAIKAIELLTEEPEPLVPDPEPEEPEPDEPDEPEPEPDDPDQDELEELRKQLAALQAMIDQIKAALGLRG